MRPIMSRTVLGAAALAVSGVSLLAGHQTAQAAPKHLTAPKHLSAPSAPVCPAPVVVRPVVKVTVTAPKARATHRTYVMRRPAPAVTVVQRVQQVQRVDQRVTVVVTQSPPTVTAKPAEPTPTVTPDKPRKHHDKKHGHKAHKAHKKCGCKK